MIRNVVIAGAGHGGVQVALSLRQNGFDGGIILLNGESCLPYQRPPLSKAYLLGKMRLDGLWLRPASFYIDNQIDLRCDTRVVELDPTRRQLTLSSGEVQSYDHLVLSVGARNRVLPLGNANLVGIQYIRTFAEADRLRSHLEDVKNIVVIGAGFVGLEFAAAAKGWNKNVTILEMADRPMGRAVCSVVSGYFTKWHEQAGAEFRFGAAATRLHERGGRVCAVETSEGHIIQCDMVIASIGVVPNIEVARDAGLTVDNGIVVDERLLTSDPNISAIGDCAQFPSLYGGAMVRLESVQNANDQAKFVARRLLGVAPPRYDAVPWFWSDQGDQKLQMVGICGLHDRVVLRGDPALGSFSAFCYAGDRLLAVESVNRPADHMFGRRALPARSGPTFEQVVDVSFDLRTIALN